MIGHKKNKKIVFCFKDFYPSNIPYCHILHDIIEECCQRGLSVSVITTQQHDKNKQKKMLQFFKEKQIKATLCKKTNNKKLGDLLFPIQVFFHLLLISRSRVIVPSSPPVIMGFSVFLARIIGFFRFEYIYHCQDIHPEALQITRIIKNKVLLNTLYLMDSLTVKYAKSVICLSADMKKTLIQRNTYPLNNIKIINNFVPNAYSSNTSLNKNKPTIKTEHQENDCLFVFAGNLGVFQNLDMLLEGFLSLKPESKAHLYFIGDGKIKKQLIQKNDTHTSPMKKNVYFLDKMESSHVIDFISTADYGIVSVSEGILEVAFPSKIMTYLSIGLPIFLCSNSMSEKQGKKISKKIEIGNEILSNYLGFLVNTKSIASIQKGFKKAIENNDFYRKQHQQIKKYYHVKYNKKEILSALIETIEET